MLKGIQQLYKLQKAKRVTNTDFSQDQTKRNREIEEVVKMLNASENYRKMTSAEKFICLEDELILRGLK